MQSGCCVLFELQMIILQFTGGQEVDHVDDSWCHSKEKAGEQGDYVSTVQILTTITYGTLFKFSIPPALDFT